MHSTAPRRPARRAAARPRRRPGLHAALRHGAAQRLGDELRRAVGQRRCARSTAARRRAASPTTPARAACPTTTCYGGDLIWELGSGYFGARTHDGGFDRGEFADKAAHAARQVRVAQAQPGRQARHRRRAARRPRSPRRSPQARGVPQGETCVSPAAHSAFSHAARAGALHRPHARAGGRQAGRLQALRRPPRATLLAICKAMLEEGTSRRTSSSSTAPRAAPARRRWSTPTTSARRSPRA